LPLGLFGVSALLAACCARSLGVQANPVYWRSLSEVRGCAVVGAAVGAGRGEVTFRAFTQRGQSRNSGIVGAGLDNRPRGASESHDWQEKGTPLPCGCPTEIQRVALPISPRLLRRAWLGLRARLGVRACFVLWLHAYGRVCVVCRYEFSARTLPLGDVLALLGAPKRLDYFSLDIEGAELMVRDAG
jgi:hypothetical protein